MKEGENMNKLELVNDEVMKSVVGGVSGVTLSSAQFTKFIDDIAIYFGINPNQVLVNSNLIYKVVYVKGVNFKVDLYSVQTINNSGVVKTTTGFQLVPNGPFVSPYVIHDHA